MNVGKTWIELISERTTMTNVCCSFALCVNIVIEKFRDISQAISTSFHFGKKSFAWTDRGAVRLVIYLSRKEVYLHMSQVTLHLHSPYGIPEKIKHGTRTISVIRFCAKKVRFIIVGLVCAMFCEGGEVSTTIHRVHVLQKTRYLIRNKLQSTEKW